MLGLQNVLDSIPRTKNLHLDEALLRVIRPTQWSAEYPFRRTLESSAGGGTPSDPQPGPSGSGDDKRPRPNSGKPSDDPAMEEKKGTVRPRHSCRAMKYGEKNLPKIVEMFLRNDLCRTTPKINMQLLGGSLAQPTWKRYEAVLRTWRLFNSERGGAWKKITASKRGDFIGWCKEKGKLKSNSVKVYFGALKKLAELKKQLEKGGGELLEKGLLKGYETLSRGMFMGTKRVTTPVDVKILDRIRKGITKMGWTRGSEICLWSATLVAFWGVFRLGEIFLSKEDCFDRFSDLLWRDVTQSDHQKIVLKIKKAKIPSPLSSQVSLFAIRKKEFCPVTALNALESFQKKKGIWKIDLPVFRRNSGRNLTKTIFLKAVNASIAKQPGEEIILSGKSFRSGIPSSLESFPENFCENHLKSLGRWKSKAYQRYMRNDDPEFRWVFRTMSDRLLTDFFVNRENSGHQTETPPDTQQRQQGR